MKVSGPAWCADAETIAEQASGLLGRPLASVAGVDFEVGLSRSGAAAWTLRLDTVEATSEPPRRSREIRGSRCEELADAAAVGIAMSVRALVTPAAADPPATATVVPAPAASLAVPAPQGQHARPALVGRLSAVGDGGALPGPTVGVELGAAVRLSAVRLGLSGAAFVPRTAHATGDRGGEVKLFFGALELCAPAGSQRLEIFGCAAFELGRLSAEGVGISRPRLGSVLWEAARAELGVGFPLRPRLALVARAGAALALSRPQFVIDGTTPVHQPSVLMVRAAVGLESEL